MTSDNSSSSGDTITDVDWTEESVGSEDSRSGPWAGASERIRRLRQSKGWLRQAVRMLVALVAILVIAALVWLWFGIRDNTMRLAGVEDRTSSLGEQVATLESAPDATSGMDRFEERLGVAEDSIAGEAGTRQEQLAGLMQELSNLAVRLHDIEQTIAAVRVSGDADSASASARFDLENSLESLDNTGAERSRRIDALEADVAVLREALENLAVAVPDGGTQDGIGAAFIVVLGQLRDAVDSGDVFTGELEAVAALETRDSQVLAALDVLAGHAETGIPTHDELKDTLGDVLASAMNADKVAAAAGWVDKTLARLESLVTVKRIDGDIAGTDIAVVALRIETKVAAGDLDAALRELDSLPAPAAEAMQGWAGGARARAEALAALERLHRWSIARVMAGAQ